MLKLSKVNNRGFTILEVILSVALIGLLAGLSAPLYQSFQNRNELDIASNSLVQSLRRAQVLSQAVDGDSSWGVHVATGTITVFQGTSYATRTSGFDEVFSIPEHFSITGTTEYVFTRFYGELTGAGTTTLVSNAEGRVIEINTKGAISVSLYTP